jgi:EAL domain-containing protein (putative c-di-GMP-specific phosphodiesterase class I)
MGIRVVAEGIETLDQDCALTELCCDFGQGYLYARPGPAAFVEELLAGPLGVKTRVPNPAGA